MKHISITESELANRFSKLPASFQERVLCFGPLGVNKHRHEAEQFDRDLGETTTAIRTDKDPTVVTQWLAQLPIDPDEKIFIWWPWEFVETEWAVFSKYWEDLLQPGSDDVTIWTKDQSLVLCYDHFEYLRFGKREHTS